jgi:hypothetical protein
MGNLSDVDSQQGGTTRKRIPTVFPPPELRNTTNFEAKEDEAPLFVIQETVEALRADSSISLLDLSSLQLRKVDLEALTEELKVSTTLISLVSENCALDDENIAILVEGLDEAKDIPLTKLYSQTNQISNGGIDALSTFLEANMKSEKLDVSRNSLSSMGTVAIFNAFH